MRVAIALAAVVGLVLLLRRHEPRMSAEHTAYLERIFAWRDLERVDSV